MEELTQVIKSIHAASQVNISVICAQSKDYYLKHPKMVQRLPREERAYWYWFIKNN